MKILRSFVAQNFLHVSTLSVAVLLTGLLCGCGVKTYEDRSEMTKKYYDYIDRLNQNLGPQFADVGVTMRVPKQFVLIPAPPRRPKKKGEAASEKKRDPRQPDHLDINLPGLIGAWKADLNAVVGADSKSLPGSIYLLSNAEFWRAFKTPRETISPLKFHEEVMKVLTNELGIRIDERKPGSVTDRVNKWFVETVPAAKDVKFAPKKEVTTITLVPKFREGDDGFAREYQVYLFANGDMKIVLVYALPRNVSASEEIENRILFSLQTLNVSPDKPIAPSTGGQPVPAQPAGPAL